MKKNSISTPRALAATILVTLIWGCAAKIHVQKQPKPPAAGGPTDKPVYVFYALPKTVVEIQLPVTAKVRSPGKYAGYTAALFPEIDPDDYVTKPEINLKFGKPEIGAFAVPDRDQVYRIKIKKPWAGLFGDRMINLTTSEEGILNHAEASASNQAVEAALAIARIGAGYLPAHAGLQPSDLSGPKGKETAKELVNEAQAAALEIRSLERALRRLITEPGACCAEAAIRELKAEIALQLEAFVGTTNAIPWTATFAWEPDPKAPIDEAKDLVLMRYSATGGVCEAFFGAAIPAGLSQKDCTPTASIVLAAFPQEGIYKDVHGAYKEPAADEVTGFRYKLPATVPLAVFQNSGDSAAIELGRGVAAVAQLGYTATLPRSTGSRKTQFILDLYPSGALKNFHVASEARLKASDIDATKESLDTYLERRSAARSAAAPPDELEELERERRILEEQIRIRRYNEELETGVPAQPL